MAMEFRFGLTEQNTLATGPIIRRRVKGFSSMPKGMFTKENLEATKQMDLEYILMSMEVDMRGTGMMTCKRAMAQSFGVMEHSTQEITSKARNMDSGLTPGSTARNTREIGMRIKLKDMELIHGLTVEFIRGTG